MAKKYTNEQIEAFRSAYYQSGKATPEEWYADKDPKISRPSLEKMKEILGLTPPKEKKPTYKELVQKIANLEAQIRGMKDALGAQAART